MSSDKAQLLLQALRAYGRSDVIAPAVAEFRFCPTRRWRFDWAWPEQRLAVEVDGGRWAPRGGRHAGDGDREKLNAAVLLGWRVLRFSTQQLETDPLSCAQQVDVALRGAEPPWLTTITTKPRRSLRRQS